MTKEKMNQEIEKLRSEIIDDLIVMKHKSDLVLSIEEKDNFDKLITKADLMDMSIK